MNRMRPWYRWHVNRWRNSPHVLDMPLAAQGAYRNLLDAAWNNEAKLSNNPNILWHYAMAESRDEFAKLAEYVLPMFTVSQDGKWLTNETLTEEWNAATEWFNKKSKAGKSGSTARWGNTSAIAEASHSDNNDMAPLSDSQWQNMASTPHHTTTQQDNIKTICAEQNSALFDVTLPLNKGEYAIPLADIAEYSKLYPATNVEQEIRGMRGWLIGSPKNRKTKSGIKKFINGWLARAQDRGGLSPYAQEAMNGTANSKADRRASRVSEKTNRLVGPASLIAGHNATSVQNGVAGRGVDTVEGDAEILLDSGDRSGK